MAMLESTVVIRNSCGVNLSEKYSDSSYLSQMCCHVKVAMHRHMVIRNKGSKCSGTHVAHSTVFAYVDVSHSQIHTHTHVHACACA